VTTTPALRRWLIAAGVARYDAFGPEDQLPSVEHDVKRMADLFCGELGYTRVLAELGDSPTGAQLRDGLSDWLARRERDAADAVVIYLSGHGASGADGRHYLLGRDFDERNFLGRALALEDLGRMLAGAEVRRLLVLVDVCYAGQGTSEFAGVHALLDASRASAETVGAGIYLVAASRRREQAREGAFSRVFADAVHAVRHGGRVQAHLDALAVIAAVNERLEREFPGQRAELHALGLENDLSPLIPNPRYVPGLPAGRRDGGDPEQHHRGARERKHPPPVAHDLASSADVRCRPISRLVAGSGDEPLATVAFPAGQRRVSGRLLPGRKGGVRSGAAPLVWILLARALATTCGRLSDGQQGDGRGSPRDRPVTAPRRLVPSPDERRRPRAGFRGGVGASRRAADGVPRGAARRWHAGGRGVDRPHRRAAGPRRRTDARLAAMTSRSPGACHRRCAVRPPSVALVRDGGERNSAAPGRSTPQSHWPS
jgi:hypothetical protein